MNTPKFYMNVILAPYVRIETDKNSVVDRAVKAEDKLRWPEQWAEFEKGEGRMDTQGMMDSVEDLQKAVAALEKAAAKLGKRVVILEKAEPLGYLEDAATVTSPYKPYKRSEKA